MQVFQRKESVLGGIDEAIAVLKQCTGHRGPDGRWVNTFKELEVCALYEGDEIAPWETVMTIEGDYAQFAHLETVYLGCLARRTLIMRNVHEVVEAANGKPILYFPARHDHWLVQTGDGWAAHVAGAIGVSTDAQASWWGGRGVGTVPHGLIAAYGGDTALAAVKFADRFAARHERHRARRLRQPLARRPRSRWPTRSATTCGASGSTRPTSWPTSSLQERLGDDAPTGVNPELVRLVREGLDAHGHRDVKIVVSGGFNADRIREFEAEGVPVDAYGVGSSLIRGSNDFTADVVMVDGRPGGKVGRELRPNPRLSRVS